MEKVKGKWCGKVKEKQSVKRLKDDKEMMRSRE